MKKERHFRLDSDEYPFEDHWMQYLGAPMHYLDVAERPASKASPAHQNIPVLLLHGNPTWSFLYRKVIAEIDGARRCVAPDYPGFGFSGHPKEYTYTPQQQADAVVALVDHLELEKFILMIQDWGGPIGIDVATRYPDRVAGLVIGNTWSWRADGLLTLFSKILGGPLGKHLILNHNLFASYFMKSTLEQLGPQPASTLNAYSKPFPTRQSRTGTWVFPKAISGEREWLDGLEKKLVLLADKPVELVWGMQDPLMSRDTIIKRWQQHFPKAGLTKVDKAGHFLQETAYRELVQAINRIQS
jgi:haloalkane dehalogenase